MATLAGREAPIALNKDRDIKCRIEFHPPDNRHHDLDGCLSAIKSYLDGITDAYGINDQHLNPIILERLDPVRNGEVIIEI